MTIVKKYLYFIAFAHLSVDISTGSLAALLPFFVTEYNMDYKQITGLMFASSFLSSIIQPLFGYWADKGNRYWFMALGVTMTGVCLSLTGYMDNYWILFALVTFMGIGAAIFHPEAAKMVNIISGKQKAAGMSIFSVGGNGGFGLGPLLAVFLLTTFGMKGTAFYGMIGVTMGILQFIFVPRIMKAALAAENTTDKTATTLVHNLTPAGVNDWSAFLRLTVTILFRATVYSSLASFLPLYCIKVLGTSPAVGNGALSLLSLSGIIATLIGGNLADRFGYVKILRYGSLGLMPLLTAMILSHNIYAIYALLLPFSFFFNGTYSSFVVLGQSYLAKNIGFASGITLGISFSAGGIMVPSLGWFADIHGIESVMMLIIVIAACCGLSTLFLPEPKKN